MLGKVNLSHYEKCYPSRLKNFFKADFGYKNYDSFVPQTKSKLVGNLPYEIINLWDKKDREQHIKRFYIALSNMTKYLRACYKECKKNNIISYSFNDLDSQDLKMLEKDFSVFFNKLLKGIVPKNIKASVSYVDKGYWGNVFKLSMYDKNTKKTIMHDKALKVFHNIKCNTKSFSNSQGVYAEANFWTYLKNIAGHKLDKTQFTRHYVSDLQYGYSLTEFADQMIAKTTAPLDIDNLFKIFYADITNEAINTKIYDVGGCLKYPEFIKDKVVMRYFKKLMHRNPGKDIDEFLKNLNEKSKNPKTPHRSKIQEAIRLFELEKNKDNQVIQNL